MEQKERIIEVRDRNGGLLFSFSIIEKPTQDPKEVKNSQPDSKGNENPLAHDGFMTDAQKRYLFRLLAEQGKEGEEAHEHLKKLFRVSSLKEVTKLEASQAIERLLASSKGGAGK